MIEASQVYVVGAILLIAVAVICFTAGLAVRWGRDRELIEELEDELDARAAVTMSMPPEIAHEPVIDEPLYGPEALALAARPRPQLVVLADKPGRGFQALPEGDLDAWITARCAEMDQWTTALIADARNSA
jgi:hypothetical protein